MRVKTSELPPHQFSHLTPRSLTLSLADRQQHIGGMYIEENPGSLRYTSCHSQHVCD
jgi:hypothetical protein